MDLISTRASEVMTKAMDGLLARHQAISSNLANVDTPNYKPVRVDFEDQLRQALTREDAAKEEALGTKTNTLMLNQGLLDLRSTDKRHFGAKPVTLGEVAVNAYQESAISYRNDDNGVDVDVEMAELAKNDMRYEGLAALQGKSFALMKEMIRGAGGV